MDLGAPITSRSNARVKALRASLSGDASKPGDLLGIEGEHLIGEAIRSRIIFETIYVRAGSEAILHRPSLSGLHAKHWALLDREVFASAVDTASPQGIAATIAIPDWRVLEMRANPEMFVFLEDIQDPGNLGTLIRSAEAFGVRCMYLSPGTVNAWNPKVVRASAGSIFRMRVFTVTLREFASNMTSSGVKTVAAVVRGEGAVSSLEADLHAPCAVMIGSEGAGLSDEALSVAKQLIHIPCEVESLNAAIAGSVLLYEAARQNQHLFVRDAL